MNLTWIIVVIALAALAWWLSRYDSMVTGENTRDDLIRRFSRIGGTVVAYALGTLTPYLMVFMLVAIAVLWAGCVSELFARGFHWFVDPQDRREFDPKQVTRELDHLSALVRDGRNEEAIELCNQLLITPAVSAVAIETMLLRLYGEKYSDDRLATTTALANVQRLREQQRFAEAASALELRLKEHPQDLETAMMLMRTYAQELESPTRARAVLRNLDATHLPPAFSDFANRRINEWSGSIRKSTEGVESLLVNRATPSATAAPIDTASASVDELLAAGHLATAIELLENKIQSAPENFDLRMKLAEAHGIYCGNWLRAGKIIEKIAVGPFTAEQARIAKEKLKGWKTSRPVK